METIEISKNVFLLCCFGYCIIGIGTGVIMTLLTKRNSDGRTRSKRHIERVPWELK